MEILGNRKYVEIPGAATHELPPLLVSDTFEFHRLDRIMNMASDLIDKEDLLPSLPIDDVLPEGHKDRRKMDMALNLVEMYKDLVRQWKWGDGILEWIRQCETTFESRCELRPLLRPDVWPHAGRSSFVQLLEDKAVPTEGVEIEKAVGLRLTFRQPPPLSFFSDQFLFYLNSSVAGAAYTTWAKMSPEPVGSLPPERFHVEVVKM